MTLAAIKIVSSSWWTVEHVPNALISPPHSIRKITCSPLTQHSHVFYWIKPVFLYLTTSKKIYWISVRLSRKFNTLHLEEVFIQRRFFRPLTSVICQFDRQRSYHCGSFFTTRWESRRTIFLRFFLLREFLHLYFNAENITYINLMYKSITDPTFSAITKVLVTDLVAI